MGNSKIINKNWKFYLGDEPQAYYKGFDDSAWRDVTLPHDWSVEQPFDKKNSSGTGYLPGGKAWYRKSFELPDDIIGKKVYISFGGVYKNSRVWCNSNNIGRRPYGYSSFTYDISEFVVPGRNVVSVFVEHETLADSRWFTGSGIYRDVTLTICEPVHFAQDNDGIFVYTENVSAKSADIIVEWKLCGGEADVEFFVTDESGKCAVSAKTQGSEGKLSFTLDKPVLWSCDAPNLYTLESRAFVGGECTDTEKTVFGVRSIRFDPDKGFFLNDESMKIKGVCLHHDAGALGAAVPKEVWRRRLEKLRAAGCNAIRTSHNPPDSLLLDLCDEMGFLVQDEAFDEWEGCKNKWWQGHNVYPPKHFGYSEDYPEWHEVDLTAMIKRDRNHPCVIMWSIGNEVDYPNDPYCHPDFNLVVGNNDANKPAQERIYDANKPNAQRLASIARELAAIVKKSDLTRPVTAALAFPELANIIGYSDALDIAGYNYKEQLYENDHKKYPSRVIYGSENSTGAAEWGHVRDNDYICAQFLWTGVDYMGEAQGWPVRVATPGLLNLAGFEKPLYYLRKALWTQKATAKLAASKNGNIHSESFSWNYEKGEKVIVSCYTNCENAELFLNGKSLGEKKLDKNSFCRAFWELEFESGELHVKCGGENGNAEDTLITSSKAVNMLIEANKSTIKANGSDIAQIEITALDEAGIFTPGDDMEISFALVGDAEIIGIENGNPSDLTPYTSKKRKTFNGKMIVYLRSGMQKDEIRLYASSENGTRKLVEFRQE